MMSQLTCFHSPLLSPTYTETSAHCTPADARPLLPFLSPTAKGDALHASELHLALEKMNFERLRALHEVRGVWRMTAARLLWLYGCMISRLCGCMLAISSRCIRRSFCAPEQVHLRCARAAGSSSGDAILLQACQLVMYVHGGLWQRQPASSSAAGVRRLSRAPAAPSLASYISCACLLAVPTHRPLPAGGSAAV